MTDLNKAISYILLHHHDRISLLFEVLMVHPQVLAVPIQVNVLFVKLLINIFVSRSIRCHQGSKGSPELSQLGFHVINLCGRS